MCVRLPTDSRSCWWWWCDPPSKIRNINPKTHTSVSCATTTRCGYTPYIFPHIYIYKFVYFILCNEIKMFAPAGRRSARAVCLCQRSAQFQICCWIAHPHIWVHTHTNNVVNIKAWIFMFASIKFRLGVSFVCVCLGGDWRTDWVGVDGVLSWWSVRMEDSDG